MDHYAVVCFHPHRGMQAKFIGIGAQGLTRRTLPRHRAPQNLHRPPGTGSEGDAVGDDAGRMLLHQAAARGQLGAVAFVVDWGAIPRPQGLGFRPMACTMDPAVVSPQGLKSLQLPCVPASSRGIGPVPWHTYDRPLQRAEFRSADVADGSGASVRDSRMQSFTR